MNEIKIPLNKTKMFLLLLCALTFVAFGVFFIIDPNKFVMIWMPYPTIIRIAGIASVIFFGAAIVVGIKKIMGNDVGLIIDENGIFDNTNASSIGQIKWAEIKGIKKVQVMSTKALLIFVNDPDEIISKAHGIKRILLTISLKISGTPLSISPSTLKIDFNKLEKLLKNKMKEHLEKSLKG